MRPLKMESASSILYPILSPACNSTKVGWCSGLAFYITDSHAIAVTDL